MGDLIQMTRPTASSPRVREVSSTSAEILFFTGVRYYRMAEDEAGEVKTRRRRSTKPSRRAARLERLAQA